MRLVAPSPSRFEVIRKPERDKKHEATPPIPLGNVVQPGAFSQRIEW